MEIRDLIHGSIDVHNSELPIIDSRVFQRLRQIKQLGFAEHSFPSATHNRYIHSLGAMATASRAFDAIAAQTPELFSQSGERFRAVTRLAALLHDVGHGPLSHTTEFTMPEVSALKLPYPIKAKRQATHEDYTLKIILDSPLTPFLDRAGQSQGFTAKHVAALISSECELTSSEEDFFHEHIDGVRVSFRPILSQLISSELDADRMDYLRRDSLMCGVSYGQFDADWLMNNLTGHIQDQKCYLSLQHRALFSFEDFLISRFHMFLMVYYHYKSAVYDSMLKEYLESPDCTYQLPADIEAYTQCDDAHLYSHLVKSSNEWAKRITEKKPYRVLVELHTGIPATKTAEEQQVKLLTSLERDLKTQNLHYLKTTSTGVLSKYAGKPTDPIFVRYDNHYSAPQMIPLQECTDLFKRYEKKRSITRLYVAPEEFRKLRLKGRALPLQYQDQLN